MAFLDHALCLDFHCPASCIGLHAAAPAARAARAPLLDDHVANLPCVAATVPQLPVECHATADARSPEDAQQRFRAATGAEQQLRVGGHRHVVAELHARPKPL